MACRKLQRGTFEIGWMLIGSPPAYKEHVCMVHERGKADYILDVRLLEISAMASERASGDTWDAPAHFPSSGGGDRL